MLRVIQRCFNKSSPVQDPFSDLPDLFGQISFQLSHGSADSIIISRINDIDHRLRLGKVDPSVQKCSLGKFPGLRHSGSGIKDSLKHPLHHQDASMAVDLNRILPGIGMRGRHIHDKDLVRCFT